MKITAILKKILFQCFLITLFSIFGLFFFSKPAYASTVTLTPSSGVAGQVVIITGSGFDNSSTATITFDGAALTTTPSTVTTTSAGALPATGGTLSFTVPSGAYGAHTVQITTGSTNIGVATFTISTPAVAISTPSVPTAGLPPGVTLTVTATNLEASKTTTFYYDDTSMGTSTSTVNGTAELVFAIPDVNNSGAHVIKASNSTYAVASTTMTVATPSITVAPSTTAVGTLVSITGTNFKAGGAVSFLFNGSSLSTDTSVTANGAGSFATTFTVPNAAAGANTVRAQSYTNLYATATLTVSTPAITVSPTSGAGGLSITVSGTGFKSNSTVSFYINGSKISTTASTNNLGTFQAAVTMPSGAPSGAQTIRAQTDDVNFDTDTFTITAAAVTASPTTGAPGTKVTLVGTNFDPSTKVVIKWNGTVIKPEETDLTTTNMGAFQGNITIPSGYVSGNGQIEISTSSSSKVLVAYTIANPALTLSATSGLPGAKITVTGTSYEGNSLLTLKWDDGVILTSPATITTTPLGSFFAVITIPNASRGVHYVSAAAGELIINASTPFTITAPAVTLSTTTGQSSNRVTVSGTGFRPKTEVAFTWDNAATLAVEDAPITTDASGFFSATFIVPKTTGAGIHIFLAKTGNDMFATSSFTVTTGTLSLSKSNGGPLSTIQLTGTSFDANRKVSVYWDNKLIKTTETTTDGIGNFVLDIKIPLTSNGVHTIKAITGDFNSAVADFTIDPPILTVSPAGAKSGNTITIQGAGFVAGKPVTLLVNNSSIKTQPEIITTDGNGNFLATITVPNTLGASLSISASTGDSYVASVDYPITQSELLIAAINIGKYGTLVLFIIGFLFFLKWSYITLKDPVKRAALIKHTKKIINTAIEMLRDKLSYFMQLSNHDKVVLIKTFLRNIVPHTFAYLQKQYYAFLRINKATLDSLHQSELAVASRLAPAKKPRRWGMIVLVFISITVAVIGFTTLMMVRTNMVAQVEAEQKAAATLK